MHLVLLPLALFAGSALYAQASLEIRLLDPSGATVPKADTALTSKSTGSIRVLRPDGEGRLRAEVPRGDYELRVTADGFAPERRDLRVEAGMAAIEIQLRPATLAQEMIVASGQVLTGDESLRRPGSYDVVTSAMMTESRVFNVDEAMRKVPGVTARSEEGFSMRPNFGIRGLNPTRSTKVLLLEDGIPLSYAPYGDNASYYHPPIERFSEIEVVKGASQILYGPMTVGGVINYLTPAIPSRRAGSVAVTGGNRDYLNAHMQYGFNVGQTGVLLDGLRKQGEGARDNVRIGMSDFNAKTNTAVSPAQTLGLKFNYFRERSQVTYSGLREAEWVVNPFQNPFSNDRFDGDRYGVSGNHTWAPWANFVLTTAVYGSFFERNWWRQSSNSNQRPNDAADPVCGGMANLYTTCGNEGRLRRYTTWGIAPVGRASATLGRAQNLAEFGFRYHDELQERQQQNGPMPTSRSGVVVENNRRTARASSAFIQDQLNFGKLLVSGGVRFESIDVTRTNRLGAGGAGAFGKTSLREWIPGGGISFTPVERITFFAGAHRGFAPPRVEDIITNAGVALDLDAERSWNYEAGVRTRLARDFRLDATFFRMDFSNQIVPSSVAGGAGAVLTNAGETLHQGVEVGGRWTKRSLGGSRHGMALYGAYTHLPTARYEGVRFSNIGGFGNVRITGNRLPYAPENNLTASAHYLHASGMNAMVEGVYVGRMFGDDLNTVGGTPDGQRGLIPSMFIWNAAFNYPIEAWRTTVFVTTKNLADRLYIADRTRGLIPGMPRQIQAGLRFTF
jgi:Fe(3+) dicitrate transport protein